MTKKQEKKQNINLRVAKSFKNNIFELVEFVLFLNIIFVQGIGFLTLKPFSIIREYYYSYKAKKAIKTYEFEPKEVK